MKITNQTVGEILDGFPRSAPIFRKYAIDNCCSRGLTIHDAAIRAGVDPAALALEIEGAAGDETESASPKITPDMTVREVMSRFPQTLPVFNQHGLTGCGGDNGPLERTDLFAIVHRIAPGQLVAELNEAASKPLTMLPVIEEPKPIYGRFLKGALWMTLTLGTLFGAVNLLSQSWPLMGVPRSHVQSHAHAQIFGFAGLFLMGVAYHVLPRMTLGRLAWPRAAEVSFVLMLAGALLRSLAQPCIGWWGPAANLTGLSGVFELCALGIFVATVLRLAPRGGREPFLAFVRSGTLWLALAALLNAAAALRMAFLATNPILDSEWNLPIRFVSLYGFLLIWIYGLSLRTLPVFLGLGDPKIRLARLALVLVNAGTACYLVSFLPIVAGSFQLSRGLALGGEILVALSAIVFVPAIRILARTKTTSHAGLPDGHGWETAIRFAYGFLLVWSGLTLFAGAKELLFDRAASNLVADGALHTFTTGFLLLMITGMASRVLPVFRGVEIYSGSLVKWTTGLLAAGTVLRWLQIAASAGAPALYRWTSLSGLVLLAAVILFSVNLFRTLAKDASAGSSRSGEPVTVQNLAHRTVADVLSASPGALSVFVRHGFGPLANPVLRNTFARAITVEIACRMHRIDLAGLIKDLEPLLSGSGER